MEKTFGETGISLSRIAEITHALPANSFAFFIGATWLNWMLKEFPDLIESEGDRRRDLIRQINEKATAEPSHSSLFAELLQNKDKATLSVREKTAPADNTQQRQSLVPSVPTP